MAPQVQQAYGLEPQTAQGQIETSYLLFLGLVFVIIILEGLFIAISVSNYLNKYIALRLELISLREKH